MVTPILGVLVRVGVTEGCGVAEGSRVGVMVGVGVTEAPIVGVTVGDGVAVMVGVGFMTGASHIDSLNVTGSLPTCNNR